MEKYRSSADPSTGLHPFLPPAQLSVRQILMKGVLSFPVRLPVGAVLLLVHFLFRVAGQFFRSMGSHPPGRLLELIGDFILRGALSAVGVRAPPPGGRLPAEPRHGDVIYANHASYLDVVYLTAHLSPTFLVPRADALVLVSPLGALTWALGGAAVGPRVTISGGGNIARRQRRGPVIVLAEGAGTNGAGVLRFVHTMRPPRGHAYALGMRYSRTRAECFTVGSRRRHFFSLLAERRGYIGARIVYLRDQQAVDLQKEVARLAGVPALSVDRETREKFLTHWEETSGGQGTSAYKSSK